MPTALTVEDGTNVANANTYISQADADTYFDDRLHSAGWTGATSAVKDQSLIQGTRLLDRMVRWVGERLFLGSQALEWPRQYVKHVDGKHFLDPNVIPDFVQWAQCELAIQLIASDLTATSSEVGLRSLKVDVMEIEFDGKVIQTTIPKIVNQLISGYGLVTYGGGFRAVKLA